MGKLTVIYQTRFGILRPIMRFDADLRFPSNLCPTKCKTGPENQRKQKNNKQTPIMATAAGLWTGLRTKSKVFHSSSIGWRQLRGLSTGKHANSQKSQPASAMNGNHDIIYGDDHMQMRDSLRKIIEKDINPYVDEWEEKRIFPAHKVFKTLGDAGFLGVTKPTEYGGLGLDYTYSAAIAEELGYINCGALPMAIGVQTDMATPALAKFGSDKLKKEFLAPSITGDRVACLGVSEVGSGSDVASIQTKASRKGDDLIINGGKMWTTNGTQADWMCCLVNTSDGKPHANKSLVCLPMNTPVLVPVEKMINETIAYTRERKIFGGSVLDNQAVHYTLAELQTELEMLRSTVYRAIALYIQGNDVTKLASMCKLKAGRLAREAADKCLQYWGGMGFTEDVLISRMYRDMRLMSIGGGADEVMLAIICKFMNTLPKPGK